MCVWEGNSLMSCQSPEVFPRRAVLFIVGIYPLLAGRRMMLVMISSSTTGSSWVCFIHLIHLLAYSFNWFPVVFFILLYSISGTPLTWTTGSYTSIAAMQSSLQFVFTHTVLVCPSILPIQPKYCMLQSTTVALAGRSSKECRAMLLYSTQMDPPGLHGHLLRTSINQHASLLSLLHVQVLACWRARW